MPVYILYSIEWTNNRPDFNIIKVSSSKEASWKELERKFKFFMNQLDRLSTIIDIQIKNDYVTICYQNTYTGVQSITYFIEESYMDLENN